MALGERLKQLRGDRRQWEMAELLQISRSAYSMYESGHREPDFTTLSRIADTFGVTADYLLGLTDDPHGTGIPLSPEEQDDFLKGVKRVKEKYGFSDELASEVYQQIQLLIRMARAKQSNDDL